MINNHGEIEVACLLLPNMNQKIAPTSSAVGCLIVNMMVIRTGSNLLEKGIKPPVFHSANVDGGHKFNAQIFGKYQGQIHYR